MGSFVIDNYHMVKKEIMGFFPQIKSDSLTASVGKNHSIVRKNKTFFIQKWG